MSLPLAFISLAYLFSHIGTVNSDTTSVSVAFDLILFNFRFEENSIQLDDEHIRSILHWSQNRIHKLTDLVHNNLAFLWITPPEYGIQESSKYLSEKGIYI